MALTNSDQEAFFSLYLSFFIVSKLKDCTVNVSEAEVAGLIVKSESQNNNSKIVSPNLAPLNL